VKHAFAWARQHHPGAADWLRRNLEVIAAWLWAKASCSSRPVFGEDLHLIRRIEADVGGKRDPLARPRRQSRLLPDGRICSSTTSMLAIRCSRRRALPGADHDVSGAAHAGDAYRAQQVGYRTMSRRATGSGEQVWQHELAADRQGEAPSPSSMTGSASASKS